MIKSPLFVPSFVALILVAGLDFLGMRFDLYLTVWWFDVLMHFLGGLWVGLFVLWIFSAFSVFSKIHGLPFYSRAVMVLPLVLAVALSWEMFELWGGTMKLGEPNYWQDTIEDLFMGSLGGIIASISTIKII